MDFTILAELTSLLQVERHSPGQLRLKLSSGVRKHPSASGLKDLGKSSPAIRKTRLNVFTSILTVEYDTQKLPYELLDSLFACSCAHKAREIACKIGEVAG